jgi:Zn-dependent M28 family amino/carboxypeptidase
MTGMSIELEAARILTAHRSELAYTVRFVASDEEELGGLAGARAYAAHIKAQSQSDGFALVAAVDNEQSGWNCHADGACPTAAWPTFDIYSCSGGSQGTSFDYQALGDRFAAVAQTYSPLHVERGCIGPQSDHYAMWEIGVPTLVYSEHDSFGNDHFDQNGGDTFARLDTDYLVSIARPAITFQASLAGIAP